MAVSKRDYLVGIAGSRALYIALFEHARGLLPPADAGRIEPEQLVVAWTLADVAKAMGCSVSTVRMDLMRLENYAWVEPKRRPYYLGQRIGVEVHLVADGAARNQTGEVALISRDVLRLTPTSNSTPTAVPGAARGLNRKWTP